MKLYKGTGCYVKLVGALKEIPLIEMDNHGDFFSTICLNIHTPEHNPPTQYHITVFRDSALKIRQFGFPGVYLLIEGFLTRDKNIKIIAEKLIFLDTSEPNTSSASIVRNTTCEKRFIEMRY